MKKRISKILTIGLSAGLLFGLVGALFAAPVSADLMEWGIVNTPSWEDLEILPSSDILDYDIGGDGDTIYAVLESNFDCNGVGDEGATAAPGDDLNYALVKSTDGGVTWSDITDNVTAAGSLPAAGFEMLVAVAVAPDDGDWLAVAGYTDDGGAGVGAPMVVASKDGGDNFTYTGAITDTVSLGGIYDLAVSIEVDGIHNIAIAGFDNAINAALFRLKAGTWLSAAWEDTTDTTDYLGWDDGTGAFGVVVAIAFSPNFDLDDTIVILCWDGAATPVAYIQSGIWESGGGSWNANAGFPGATEIKSNGDTLSAGYYPRSMGIALPADYNGSDPGARAVFLYVNATNMTTTLYGGYVLRADNNSLSPVVSPPGDPVLASIDVHGDADTGKLMIGEYIEWNTSAVLAGPCNSVRVWHTEEIDICCVQWEQACKDPSGWYMALVMYTPDGAKEYASTSGSIDPEFAETRRDVGTPLDESAFSVSLDDGVSFNQLSLIDTDIDYLSDVAVCPDCSTIYLSTISESIEDLGVFSGESPCGEGYCNCDSVWRSYDNGDTWERIFHGNWADDARVDHLLLRLPCDELEECCTIYLGVTDFNTDPGDGDRIFYSRDCGQCWNETPVPKIDIQDFTVESENTVYVLDEAGYISKSTQYGRRWSDALDTEIGSGHTITACCDQGFVVVGGSEGGKVGYSIDGGESFELTEALRNNAEGDVHVACDPICENTIYAALSGSASDPFFGGGIYRWVIDKSSEWDNLDAYKYSYHGIVVAREGTLYAASFNIFIDPSEDLCDRFLSPDTITDTITSKLPRTLHLYSGVARNLTPCETDCCGTEGWDYIICGLDQATCGLGVPDPETWGCILDDYEFFWAEPSTLRICGCTSIATNSILYAIDGYYYDVTDGSDGALWSYEDCAAKVGPTLTSPADGSVLDCEPCAGCDAANFTLKWERMCEACSYDIQIMDEDGNLIVEWVDLDITGDPPTLFVDGTMDDDKYFLECGMSYTWKVREANTSCECVHSPWSETWSFTVAVGAADAIQLLAPTKGAMDVPINNIGFSWTSVRSATSYSFVLSPNANLSGALVSQDMSTTAFNFVGPLDYSKAYYWQIIAWQDGTRLTTSSIGVFNTMAEPETPTPPVVVEQQPAPVINIPPAEKITPTWIYAIIGIGATLAVVVIVLIVRTRRP